MPSLLRPRPAPLALCAAGAALPLLALLAAGRLDAHHLTSELHFAAVGGSALVATGASIALTAVAVRRRDARTVIVGTAFSVMAALLLLHGLASPGVLVGTNGLVSLTGGATLPVGALLLVLSTLPGLGGGRRIRFLVALEAALLADLDGEEGDASRVLLGRPVLLGQAERERADPRAQERLLGGDEVARADAARQRA